MYRAQFAIISLACIVALANSALSEPLPEAENVCNSSLPTKKDIIIERPVQYEIQYRDMCGIIPCTKTRIETRMDQVIKTQITYIEKPYCCPGYAETPDRRCAPICQRSCNNGGKCIAPDVCKCSHTPGKFSPGFVGPTCSRFICLGENRWGTKCEKDCNCQLNAYCGANTGKCICYPGYRGPNCTLECEPNSNDPECEETIQLPPILEPDVNLISDYNSIMSRQRSEALILERTPDETLQEDRSISYLLTILSCITMISLLSFYILMKRYCRLKSELCYASGSSTAPSDSSGGDYSGSVYHATSQRSMPSNNLFAKNLSFAATTRQLLGDENNKANTNNGQQNIDNPNRNKLIVNPLVESHLMRSHKPADENVYSDVKINFMERPLPDPNQDVTCIDMQSDASHIYQVPRSQHAHASLNDSSAMNDTSSLYKSITDEIYEEIKPRSPTKQP